MERDLALLSRLWTLPPIIPGSHPAGEGELAGLLERFKAAMDTLRRQLRAMRGEEQRLLGFRLEEIRRVRHRNYLVFAGTLLHAKATPPEFGTDLFLCDDGYEGHGRISFTMSFLHH